MHLYFLPSVVALLSAAGPRSGPLLFSPSVSSSLSTNPCAGNVCVARRSRAVVILRATEKEGGIDSEEESAPSPDDGGSVKNANKSPQGSAEFNPTALFENMVHSVTGDSSYKFGDLSKKTLSDVTGKDLNKESYQFGDISKNLANRAGKAVTGDEKYQFGDITKTKLQELETELDMWREENLNALPNNLFQQTFKNLSPQQRRELIIAIIRLGAIALLSWGLISNILSAGVMSMAWARTVLKCEAAGGPLLPLLPFNVEEPVWRTFLASYATLRLMLNPILLVIKGGGTLFAFQPYVRCITTIEREWIPPRVRQRYPLIFRAFALVTAFTLNNVLIPSALAALGLGLGGTSHRLFRYWFPFPVT
jgi:hypothetical protein